MKKLLLLLLILVTSLGNLCAQTISPVQSTEVCPGVNMTFTVTIAANSIIGVSPKALNANPTVVQGPHNFSTSGSNIVFDFVGKFTDDNNKQTFMITYVNTAGQTTTWDATYPKIKSLLNFHSATQIYPSPTSFLADRCVEQSRNISFTRVKYGNPFEPPPSDYGIINNYKWLLPAGWKLNSTTSDGTTWLTAGYNETVTSDLGTAGNIRIRPINTACGSGLYEGQEATIPISRPEPTITLSSAAGYICANQGTTTLTATGIPSGATVSWSIVSPANQAQFVGCTTCTTATLQRIGTSNVIATVKATVTHCTYTYERTINITLGTPAYGVMTVVTNYCLGGSDWELGLQASSPDPTVTGYLWTRDGVAAGSGANWSTYEFPPSCMTIGLKAGNACGYSTEGTQQYCPPCGYYRMAVNPNPAKGKMNISVTTPFGSSLNRKSSKTIFKLIQVDNSKVFRQWEFADNQKNYSLPLSGIRKGLYVLEMSRGTEKTSKQVVIEE